jgi:hypothetical protein
MLPATDEHTLLLRSGVSCYQADIGYRSTSAARVLALLSQKCGSGKATRAIDPSGALARPTGSCDGFVSVGLAKASL